MIKFSILNWPGFQGITLKRVGFVLITLLFLGFFCLALNSAVRGGGSDPFQERGNLETENDLQLTNPKPIKVPRPLMKVISPQDWGLKALEAISYVRFTIIHDQNGDRLEVNEIRDSVPQVVYPDRPRSRIPDLKGKAFFLKWDPLGIKNNLDGYYAPFFKRPNWAQVSLKTNHEETYLDFSFRLRPDSAGRGYAGFWIHFFNYKLPPSERIYLNASPFKYLRFYARGGDDVSRVKIAVADAEWEIKEDAVVLGDLLSFLPTGRLSSQWQEVWIPLSSPQVNWQQLASLVFLVEGHGKGEMAIKDIALTKEKKIDLRPKGRPKTPFFPSIKKWKKATWAWHRQVLEWLGDEQKLQEDIDFMQEQGFTDVFLQIPYLYQDQNGLWQLTWPEEYYPQLTIESDDPLFRPDKNDRFPNWRLRWPKNNFAPLLARFNRAGIKVKALVGRPEHALSPWHGLNLSLLAALLAYNQNHPFPEQFKGIHYDIEPYLIPGFFSSRKQAILEQYKDFLLENKKIIQDSNPQSEFCLGVDIPFWYDNQDKYFQPIAEVEGQTFDQTIIDLVDEVVVMDYRTVADGADGLIEHIKNELEYAAKRKKPIWLGVETGPLPDETLYEFAVFGKGKSAIWVEDQGEKWVIFWEKKDPSLARESTFPQVKLIEWKQEDVPAAKITFFGSPFRIFRQEIDLALHRLASFSNLVGVAIHSFSSYKKYIHQNLKDEGRRRR
ncbi:MAG: hypothetical protein DRJ06_06830 [Candidatus Aminicenantes bacterium]|nr:MAG: hypothetical protein DRJ06_06830 [Candidatus Aminicenantes bacterium]